MYWYVCANAESGNACGIVVARFGTTHPGGLVCEPRRPLLTALVLWVQFSQLSTFILLEMALAVKTPVIAWVATIRRAWTGK